MSHNPYHEWEPFAAGPRRWKRLRDSMLAISRTVPVPAGAEELWSAPESPPNTIVGPDGAEVRFFVDREPVREPVYATVDHAGGYAEFVLRDGQWRYLAEAKVMMAGFTDFWPDDLDAREVTVEAPTIAMAFEQAAAHPDLTR